MDPPSPILTTSNPFAGILTQFGQGAFGQYPLHQAIAVCTTDQVLFFIDQVEEDHILAPLLKTPVGEYSLTPLHLAAMRGIASVVASLLRHGAEPLATDRNQCTFLHLAAFHGDSVFFSRCFELVETINPRVKEARNHLFATAEEIVQSTRPVTVANAAVVTLYREDMGPLKQINAARFRALTGAVFSPHPTVPISYHGITWLFKEKPSKTLHGYLDMRYQRFKANHLIVYLQKDVREQMHVYTANKIERSAFLGVFGTSFLEGERQATPLSFITDGFPNCVPVFHYLRGVKTPVILAADSLPQDTKLQFDRGVTDPIKWEVYPTGPLKEISEFTDNTYFNSILQRCEDYSLPPGELFTYFIARQKIFYIFSTPSVLSKLILQRTLSLQTFTQVTEFLNNKYKSNTTVHYRKLITLAKILFLFMQQMDEWSLPPFQRKFLGFTWNVEPGPCKAAQARTFIAALFEKYKPEPILLIIEQIALDDAPEPDDINVWKSAFESSLKPISSPQIVSQDSPIPENTHVKKLRAESPLKSTPSQEVD